MGEEQGPEIPGLRCLEKVGSGGFSTVWLYETEDLGTPVAVKLPSAEPLDDVQRQQFASEAEVMALLRGHPFIVGVLRRGTTDDGRPYLVMDYYPPPDLGERVAETPMTVAEALRTGIQLASAVETAHRSEIIHRDIKPANVLIDRYGRPGLTDFGIAGRGAHHDDGEHLGVSPPWSAPEVLSGQSNGNAVSDVYSLGATVWNLLVGRSPFSVPGDNSERALVARILHSKPPTTGRADVPDTLERLFQQVLAKRPEQRPQTALELAHLLQRMEQRLRFDRTEIQVLGALAVRPVPQAGGTPSPTHRRTGDTPSDSAVTMLKGPARAVPSRPPTPARESLSLGALGGGSESGPADLTKRRGPATVRDAEPEEVPPERAGSPHNRAAAIAVAILLMIAAGVAIGIGTSDRDGVAERLPDPPGPSQIDDGLTDFVPVTSPEITVRSSRAEVRFAAAAENPRDQFEWRLTIDGEVGRWSPGKTARTVTVQKPARKDSTICAELRVKRGGQLSSPGEPKCWP